MLMADVPLSVSRSISTSFECRRNGLQCACLSNLLRCYLVVIEIGSTVLIRNGSMIVLNMIENYYKLSCFAFHRVAMVVIRMTLMELSGISIAAFIGERVPCTAK